jgi:hypothetical protein
VAEPVLKLRKYILLLTVLCAVSLTLTWITSLFRLPTQVNLDSACYLQYGQLLPLGKNLYTDLFDINPPLISYLHVIPAVISQVTNMNIVIVFKLLLALLTLTTISFSAIFLREKFLSDEWPYAVAVIWAEALLAFLLPKEFGQREHLFVLLFLPFFLLRCRRAEGGKVSPVVAILCGILGGIALFLKIYFLFIPAVVETIWLIQRRQLSMFLKPEVFTILVVYGTCFSQIFWLPAEARDVYFNFIVPHTIKGYAAFNAGLLRAVLMLDYVDVLVLSILLSFYAYVMRRRSGLLVPFACWTGASYMIFVVQDKCWRYQLIPLFTGLLIVSALVLVALGLQILPTVQKIFRTKSTRESTDWISTRIFFVLAAGILAVTAFSCYDGATATVFALNICQKPTAHDPCVNLKKERARLVLLEESAALLDQYSSPGDKVLFLNTGFSPAYPTVTQMDRLPGSRYTHLQLIAFIEFEKRQTNNSELLAKLQKDEDKIFAAILTDIEHNKPRMILIKQNIFQGCPAGFSLEDLMEKNHYLSRILNGYRIVDTSLNLKTYVLEAK